MTFGLDQIRSIHTLSAFQNLARVDSGSGRESGRSQAAVSARNGGFFMHPKRRPGPSKEYAGLLCKGSMKISLIGGLIAAAALAAATAAHAERRDYPVANITGLMSSIPLDLEIVQDDRESLTLDGDDGQIAEIEVVMEGGTVRIRSKQRSIDWRRNARGVLHVKQIDSMHLAGTGSMRSASIRAGDLKTVISGSGKIQLRRLDATNVNVVVSGSGNVDLGSGRVENVSITVTGAGDVTAGKLRADGGKVAITGAGTTTLWPEKTLSVSITGVGTVRYYGDPQITDRRVAGVGNVKRMQAASDGN